MVLPCKCQSEYQDKVHGKGMRVHNPCNYGYRCTVCGNEKGAGTAKPQEENK